MGDAAAETNAEERGERVRLRSQAKREAETAKDRADRKKQKQAAEHDLVASIALTSPFLCRDGLPVLPLQSRYEWAIEWSERKTLSNLPKELAAVDVKGEIISFLTSNKKVVVLCAYFGLSETSYFRYLQKFREEQESKKRVDQLNKAKEVRLLFIQPFGFITSLKV